jgi:hypothetical protein
MLTDIISPCSDRPGSHICDPEHLLSGSAFDAQSEALRRLSEVKHVSQCPGLGYEVYAALLSVPSEDAHAVAAELGRRWGVLGNSHSCGAIVLYAARERVLAVVADHALEESVMSSKIERSIEKAPLELAEPASADAVVASLVSQLTGVLDNSDSKKYVIVQQGAAIVLYGISSVIGLVVTGLLVFCLYDVMAHWFHAMRFHTCQTKVKRVHDAFLSRQGELTLCPYCVTSVSNQPSSSHVVFLCGHRFHMDCANRWFAEEPQHSGRCAICAGASVRPRKAADSTKEGKLSTRSPRPHNALAHLTDDFGQAPGCEVCDRGLSENPEIVKYAEEGQGYNDEDSNNSMNSWDEAKNFMLHSLHKEYPDIIKEADLERWCSCHTEIWLSELHCPRYKSIFATKQNNK